MLRFYFGEKLSEVPLLFMREEETFAFWIKAGELFEQTCQAFDRVWRKRKRVIDIRLLVVFILKLRKLWLFYILIPVALLNRDAHILSAA